MKHRTSRLAALGLALVLLLSLCACTTTPDTPSAPAEPSPSASVPASPSAAPTPASTPAPSAGAGVTDGSYEATAAGRNGDVKVSVTFASGKISAVEILEHAETQGVADGALENLPGRIVEANSVNVDAVSGATITSEAILTAVKDAIVQAGGSVEDFSAAPATADKPAETYTCDVVVVGAGASGTTAAVAAADEGANVILLEKTGTIGGASNLSWACTFVNSSAAVADGLVSDEEQMIADWIEDCHWRVDAACIRQFVTQSGETYDWLSEHGYQTIYMNFFGSAMHMLPTDYSSREGLLRDMLDQSVVAGGGSVITECTAKELITDGNGTVTGVKAVKADGTPVEVSAKAVVMATGGYAGNFDMVAENFGFKGVLGGLGQNVGEGLEMVWAVGAKVPDNFGGQMLHQTLARATTQLRSQFDPFPATYPMILTYVPTLMNVGPSGARFRDETATLTAVAAANTSAFNGAYHYVIVSKAQLDALIESGLEGIGVTSRPGLPPEFYADFADAFTTDAKWETVYDVLDAMVADGNGFKGDTPEALAEAAGMDVDTFMADFNAYQEACSTGVDAAFGKSAEYLLSMGEEGPYYAITAEINNLGSIGGMLVNKDFQILDDNRVAIPGLYAVGAESEGVLFNDTYVGNGIGMGYAMTSGRLGGASAARHVLGK